MESFYLITQASKCVQRLLGYLYLHIRLIIILVVIRQLFLDKCDDLRRYLLHQVTYQDATAYHLMLTVREELQH